MLAVKIIGNVCFAGNEGAVIGMLVVYCLKNVNVTAAPFALPELIALIAVAGLYVWRKNSLVSIGVGTVVYMLLVQLVF